MSVYFSPLLQFFLGYKIRKSNQTWTQNMLFGGLQLFIVCYLVPDFSLDHQHLCFLLFSNCFLVLTRDCAIPCSPSISVLQTPTRVLMPL